MLLFPGVYRSLLVEQQHNWAKTKTTKKQTTTATHEQAPRGQFDVYFWVAKRRRKMNRRSHFGTHAIFLAAQLQKQTVPDVWADHAGPYPEQDDRPHVADGERGMVAAALTAQCRAAGLGRCDVLSVSFICSIAKDVFVLFLLNLFISFYECEHPYIYAYTNHT